MKFRIVRPNMAIRKKRIKLSREVVHDLKEVSKLSYVKQWEFAGNIKYKIFEFSKPKIVTSKKRTPHGTKANTPVLATTTTKRPLTKAI